MAINWITVLGGFLMVVGIIAAFTLLRKAVKAKSDDDVGAQGTLWGLFLVGVICVRTDLS